MKRLCREYIPERIGEGREIAMASVSFKTIYRPVKSHYSETVVNMYKGSGSRSLHYISGMYCMLRMRNRSYQRVRRTALLLTSTT